MDAPKILKILNTENCPELNACLDTEDVVHLRSLVVVRDERVLLAPEKDRACGSFKPKTSRQELQSMSKYFSAQNVQNNPKNVQTYSFIPQNVTDNVRLSSTFLEVEKCTGKY